MQYSSIIDSRFLPSNGFAPLPLPQLGSFKDDRKMLMKDYRRVGQDLLVGIRKAQECQQK